MGTAQWLIHTPTTLFIAFSTKERANTIPDSLREELWAYMVGIAKNEGFALIATGGTSNHVHLLMVLPAAMPLSEAIKRLKGNSSRWMGPHFAWQEGYAAFSVSPSQIESVKSYIRGQMEHHRRRSFEDEFIALLKKCGVECDPK